MEFEPVRLIEHKFDDRYFFYSTVSDVSHNEDIKIWREDRCGASNEDHIRYLSASSKLGVFLLGQLLAKLVVAHAFNMNLLFRVETTASPKSVINKSNLLLFFGSEPQCLFSSVLYVII
jgi:hypothetical protein